MPMRLLYWFIASCLLVGTGCSSDPTDQEIITVVRNATMARTYDEVVTKTRTESGTTTQRVSCSQTDWEFDPYKDDPNRGKCRGTGGNFGYGYKTITKPTNKKVTYQETVTRQCPTPPPTLSSLWTVFKVSDGRWKVTNSNSTSVWFVVQADNGVLVGRSDDQC